MPTFSPEENEECVCFKEAGIPESFVSPVTLAFRVNYVMTSLGTNTGVSRLPLTSSISSPEHRSMNKG